MPNATEKNYFYQNYQTLNIDNNTIRICARNLSELDVNLI